eukprot:gene12755-7031_t
MNQNIEPLSYNLNFQFDETQIFNALVVIQIKVKEPTNEIFLKASDTLILGKSCSALQNKKKVSFKILKEEIQKKTTSDVLVLKSNENLQVGKIELKLSFKGEINEKICKGIYRNNNIIYTHFEPYFSRLAFPCFDEFYSKAIFELTVSYNDLNAITISNSPIKNEFTKNSIKNVVFEPTTKIPNYIFGFVIGDYRIDLSDYYEDLKIEIYVPSSSTFQFPSDLIMDTILKSILFLEEYFNSKIKETGIKKLDVVIVPKFCLGGMENHGCIFLNETDTVNINDKNRDLYIELVAHEVCHHWLGNLVSTEIWIKEGLAQYFEKIVVDEITKRKPFEFPKIKKEKKTTKSNKSNKKNNKKLPPSNSTEFSDSFNGSFYQDSLSVVVEMVEKLGKDKFQSILQSMIEKYKFAFISEIDFLELMA